MLPRSTKSRRAIVGALQAAGRPLSVSDILKSTSTQRTKLNKSTVYRFIKQLLRTDEIVAIPLTSHVTVYELKGTEPHHHFMCSECLAVFCLRTAHVNVRGLTPEGFEVTQETLMLSGRCSECRRP